MVMAVPMARAVGSPRSTLCMRRCSHGRTLRQRPWLSI
ncbi:hypothetical protein DB31_4994 [Hyalangium minutum]|uniref:Uncharacterized protein n=1 Tax=Hyalangium minutum TaxID=394096 RepID=A0A085WQI9_9BACT|nr:hypothetical protein DB31_4994 [Hyalangium minutum]